MNLLRLNSFLGPILSVSLLGISVVASMTAHGESFGRENKARILFVEGNGLEKRPWTKLAQTDEQSLQVLIKMLSRCKTGEYILELAKKEAANQGKTLEEVILPGNGSITDTTLIRKFSPKNPSKVYYETRATVFLDRGLNVQDGILDLAHELTHFTMRKAFNPYVPHFNFKGFLSSTVEGKGGEVDAYLVECQVYKELYPSQFYNNSNCMKVYDDKQRKFSKSKGVKYFYQIGEFLPEFKKTVKSMKMQQESFPHVSNGEALFISSAYGLPYPVAAMEEFKIIMGKVCRNDYRRLSYIKDQQQRFPASVSEESTPWQDLNQKLDQKCIGITNIEI